MEKKQSSQVEMLRREERIMELIQLGHSPTDIFTTIAQEFMISPRTVERQYYQIIQSLGSVSRERKQELRAVIIARQELLYQKAMDAADYKLAHAILLAMGKIGAINEQEIINQEPSLPTVLELYSKEQVNDEEAG